MSSFRLLCIAAFTAVMFAAVAAASAQTAPTADRSGKHYLAGLRPPHDHQKSAQLKTRHATEYKPSSARAASKAQPILTTKSKARRPAHLADKINSHVAWPSVEPPPTDERTDSDTVLQFATEEVEPSPEVVPHPTLTAPPSSTAKTPQPATIAATDEHNLGSIAVDTAPTASMPVQTERFEAPNQMLVIMPAPNAEPLIAPAPSDPPARSSSSTAQHLATLGGAITAAIVGWLMIGFGPFRTIKSGQT